MAVQKNQEYGSKLNDRCGRGRQDSRTTKPTNQPASQQTRQADEVAANQVHFEGGRHMYAYAYLGRSVEISGDEEQTEFFEGKEFLWAYACISSRNTRSVCVASTDGQRGSRRSLSCLDRAGKLIISVRPGSASTSPCLQAHKATDRRRRGQVHAYHFAFFL